MSKLFIVLKVVVVLVVIFLQYPFALENSTTYGTQYFWAWLTVLLPVTLRFWILPFTIGSQSFAIAKTLQNESDGNLDKSEYSSRNRTIALLILVLGFFISGQIVLHFIISPLVYYFLAFVVEQKIIESILLAAACYVAQQLTFTFVYPFLMAIFVSIAKKLDNFLVTYLAYQFRGYIRGGYPFMTWTLRQ